MTVKEASVGRDNNLNIIRLIAALMVLYMHSFAICLGDSRQDIMYFITNGRELSGGVAVDIFFIISGFLICRSYDRASSTFSYFKARFLRIWPLLFVVVFVTAFIIGPILSTTSFKRYFLSLDILSFLKNAIFINTYSYLPGVFSNHYNHSLNGSLWTLMYEVVCYILVVVISPIWKKKKVLVPIWTVILAVAYYYLTILNTSLISSGYILNSIRLFMYFSVGMTYYIYAEKIRLSGYAFLVSVIGLALLGWFWDFNIPFVIFGSYIIFFIAFQKKYVARWYEKIGDLSYGIYIMAFPIQQILLDLMGHPTEYYKTMTMDPYINMVVTLIIVLPLSYLSWHFIESPCLKLKNK